MTNKTIQKVRRAYVTERRAYMDAKQRCTNPKHARWGDYGGRGITMCDKWLRGFAYFIADVGEKPSPTHSLDRIDNERGYSPDNCRWATAAEQVANRRPRKDTLWLTIDDETKPLRAWARQYGLDPASIIHRQRKGLTGRELIMPPMKARQTRLKPKSVDASFGHPVL